MGFYFFNISGSFGVYFFTIPQNCLLLSSTLTYTKKATNISTERILWMFLMSTIKSVIHYEQGEICKQITERRQGYKMTMTISVNWLNAVIEKVTFQ